MGNPQVAAGGALAEGPLAPHTARGPGVRGKAVVAGRCRDPLRPVGRSGSRRISGRAQSGR
jgi:hypothetical protein